ncbi:MAG: hypothetical protein AAB425_03335 [Bdellovibrionota bacterium]
MNASLLALLAACGGLFSGIEIPISTLTYEEANKRLEKASQTCSAPIAESLFHTAFPRVGIQVREADALFGTVELKSGWRPNPDYGRDYPNLMRYVVQVGVPSFDFRKEFASHQKEGEEVDYQGMESITGDWGIELPGWREYPVIDYDLVESKPDAFGKTERVKTNPRLVLPKQVGMVTLINGDNGNDTQFKVDMSAYTQCVVEEMNLEIDPALAARIDAKLGKRDVQAANGGAAESDVTSASPQDTRSGTPSTTLEATSAE